MAAINSYLNFPGNAEEAFTFYKSIFGGEFAMVQRFKDGPGAENLSPEDGEKMMHIALPIGRNVLMASDAMQCMGHEFVKGNDFSLSVSVDSVADADRVYAALSDGGKPTMPMENTFWGSYFGMVTDKFAVNWMVSFDPTHN